MVNTCDACDPTPSQPKIPTPRYWNGHLRTGAHHGKDQQPSRLHLVRKEVRPKELAKNIQHLFVGFLPDSQAFSAPSVHISIHPPTPQQDKRMNPFHNTAVLRLPHQKCIKPSHHVRQSQEILLLPLDAVFAPSGPKRPILGKVLISLGSCNC